MSEKSNQKESPAGAASERIAVTKPAMQAGITLAASAMVFAAAATSWPFAVKCVVAAFIAGAAAMVQIKLAGVKKRPGRQVESRADIRTALEFLHGGADTLLALDDVNSFFGRSLQAADTFRLVSSQLNEVFAFDASALLVRDPESGRFTIAFAEGRRAEILRGLEIDADRGMAALCASEKRVIMDERARLDLGNLPPEFLQGFALAAALPLFKDGRVFATFQIYRLRGLDSPTEIVPTLDAIAQRLSPLFAGTLAFEKSIANALTDPVTELPNERALFMVLENQLAESQRYREDRPLTVLSIDISEFTDINDIYGHEAGDRTLVFASEMIKSQLRKMDFLARSLNDEFVVVLPGAAENTAREVAARIAASFAESKVGMPGGGAMEVKINIGSATFWQDGETSTQLLQMARVRKQMSKSGDSGRVLWFPREYVN